MTWGRPILLDVLEVLERDRRMVHQLRAVFRNGSCSPSSRDRANVAPDVQVRLEQPCQPSRVLDPCQTQT